MPRPADEWSVPSKVMDKAGPDGRYLRWCKV